MKGLRYGVCCALSAFFLIALCASPSAAQVEEKIDTREKRDVILYRGDLVSLKVYSLTRIAISTPGIVDIINADIDEILLVGNAIGQTQIFIWDEYGKRSVLARVMEHDLDMIKERIEQLLKAAGIAGVTMENSAYEAKIIATGKVNKSQKDLFDKVIKDFDQYVINMVDAQGDLIQIDAQVTELSKTLTEILGVDWGTRSFGVTEVPKPPTTGARNILRVVDFDRTGIITATVNALLNTSEARNLSRPSLVLSDGETATLTVGGEVPVRTSQVSEGGTTSETVSYRQYGLTFSVTAEIKDNEKVEVTLTVDIRDLDATDGRDADGGVLTTSTQTKVLLDDGQTIVIAGLIKKGETVSENKVPFLSSIPIVGLLFRNKSVSHSPDREIVISLTASIRRQNNKLKTVQELEEERLLKERATTQAVEMADDLGGPSGQWKDFSTDPLLEYELDEVLKGSDGAAAPSVPVDDLDARMDAAETLARQEASWEQSADISSAVSDYARDVQAKIAQRSSFPYAAKENGWEGVAVLSLTILSDGRLNDVSIKESSGYAIFDSDAVNTAKIVSPYAHFPVELESDEITVSVPVRYSQEAFLVK